MGKERKYTIDELKLAVELSNSMHGTLRRLGLNPTGGGYVTPKKLIKEHNIDTSHWGGQGWRKGKKSPINETKLEDYLENRQPIQSYKLKQKLVASGKLTMICSECGIKDKWRKKPLPLELDHIDGNKNNNNLSNLRILCPNCHSQTETHRKKNVKYQRTKNLT